MRKTTTVLIALVVLTIGVAAATSTQSRSRAKLAHRAGDVIRAAAERIGLEESSRQEIRWILTEAWQNGASIRAARRDATTELRNLLATTGPNDESVMQQIEVLGDISTRARKHRVNTLLKIREVLTPEQRDELQLMQREFAGQRPGAALDACAADVEALCGDLPIRGGRLTCLFENREQLSPECREAMASQLQDRLGRTGENR